MSLLILAIVIFTGGTVFGLLIAVVLGMCIAGGRDDDSVPERRP
jgi:hypothetical protein